MEKLFLGECTFFWGAQKASDLPEANLPEIAFAGRSNVGKSSLINALTNRKFLVRTSSTPGQTRQLNFFNIGGHFALVDMPGYGYAKASKADQKIWQNMMKAYLRGRVPLRLACVLIDSRHGLKDVDRDILKMLGEAAVPVRLILTKADEIKPQAREDMIKQIQDETATFPSVHPEVILTSSRSAIGITQLREAIATTLGFIAPE